MGEDTIERTNLVHAVEGHADLLQQTDGHDEAKINLLYRAIIEADDGQAASELFTTSSEEALSMFDLKEAYENGAHEVVRAGAEAGLSVVPTPLDRVLDDGEYDLVIDLLQYPNALTVQKASLSLSNFVGGVFETCPSNRLADIVQTPAFVRDTEIVTGLIQTLTDNGDAGRLEVVFEALLAADELDYRAVCLDLPDRNKFPESDDLYCAIGAFFEKAYKQTQRMGEHNDNDRILGNAVHFYVNGGTRTLSTCGSYSKRPKAFAIYFRKATNSFRSFIRGKRFRPFYPSFTKSVSVRTTTVMKMLSKRLLSRAKMRHFRTFSESAPRSIYRP